MTSLRWERRAPPVPQLRLRLQGGWKRQSQQAWSVCQEERKQTGCSRSCLLGLGHVAVGLCPGTPGEPEWLGLHTSLLVLQHSL